MPSPAPATSDRPGQSGRDRGGSHDVQVDGGKGSERSSDAASEGWEGTLPRALTEEGAQTVVWSEEGGVEQVATRLLATYRDGEPCVLCQAGYLDLLGRVWSCVVQGGGWVEICVVKEEDGASVVTLMRLDGDEVASALEASALEEEGE